MRRTVRHLVIVLGDQLDVDSPVLADFDEARDVIWMAEVAAESEYVWSNKPRIAVFLSAMRHFRDSQRAAGRQVRYHELGDKGNTQTLDGELARAIADLRPDRLLVVEPGEWRVWRLLETVAEAHQLELEVRPDCHFLCSIEAFRVHAAGRKQLRMEFFYREMRRTHRVLLDEQGEPVGGQWNFDPENRGAFPKTGPAGLPAPVTFAPDAVTRGVIAEVNARFTGHPGELDKFAWPTTREEGLKALNDFIAHRLPEFGRYQDAMWTDEPWLYHGRISAALNLKLINPREVVAAAERAYHEGHAPLASVEGFIRQILGWREYVRGVYWMFMPDYLEKNALKATQPLPAFYWTADTEMACLHQAVGQTLRHGYAHHIQRLMVTGCYSLLLGVQPKQIHEWYLAVYVDAVEWVELPNVLGMSQYADGGVMASKPYVATGKYIQRMSNYCASCRFDPAKSTGPDACPFTTLYWDFLLRHEKLLAANQRMALQVKNLARLKPADREAIQSRAREIREHGGAPPRAQSTAELPLG